MTKDIKEQIREILNEPFIEDKLIQLSSLIQSEREEAQERGWQSGYLQGKEDFSHDELKREAVKEFIDSLAFNTYYDQEDLLQEYLTQQSLDGGDGE